MYHRPVIFFFISSITTPKKATSFNLENLSFGERNIKFVTIIRDLNNSLQERSSRKIWVSWTSEKFTCILTILLVFFFFWESMIYLRVSVVQCDEIFNHFLTIFGEAQSRLGHLVWWFSLLLKGVPYYDLLPTLMISRKKIPDISTIVSIRNMVSC